jgi:hypothetical protein
MKIDTETYQLPKTNYYQEIYPKTQIVIGHNGRKDMRHYEGWKRRNNGINKKTSSYTIDKEGNIFEHFDPKYYSDFIGVEQDKSNISITLVNVGWLKLDPINNIYTDWLGHVYSKKTSVLEKTWRDRSYWVKYTEEQIDSLKYLVDKLCDQFEIPKECIGNNVYNENVDIYKGITFRSNYSQEIRDISPAFEVDLLNEL